MNERQRMSERQRIDEANLSGIARAVLLPKGWAQWAIYILSWPIAAFLLARYSAETVLGVLFGALFVGGVVVAYGTIAKNRWGINLHPVTCPRCNTRAPAKRIPRSKRQRLWGGGTCEGCGAELDKWGRIIDSP